MTEHKFSEKFSQDEQFARDEYLADLWKRLDELEADMVLNCREIAGNFRGPGTKVECTMMVRQILLRFGRASL